jgi:predicted kinase
MKTLSQTTPHVLFMIGIPGAGKTYFARKFSHTFEAPFIEAEAFRRAIVDTPTYSREEDGQINKLVELSMAELLKTKRTFLCEANLESRAARQRFTRMAKESGYEPLMVWVQTEPSTAEQRATKPMRARDEKVPRSPISKERYDQLSRNFTPPNATEKSVVISGKHTYAVQAKVVLKRLARTLEVPLKKKPLTVPERPADTTRKSARIHIN